MHKSISNIYMVIFLTIIFGFGMVSIILPDKDISISENRALKRLPSISAEAISTRSFFEDMNQYLNDQIVFRDNMVRIYQKQQNSEMFNSMLFENMLNVTRSQKPEEGTTIEDSRIVSNLVLINNKWILPKQDKVVHTKHMDVSTAKLNDALKFAREQETETFFVLNPSRTKSLMHLYPEYLQTDAYDQSQNYFLSQLDKDINVVNIRNKFDTFTQAQLEELYFETDHHWNIKGAFTAYQEMITQISKLSTKFEEKPMSIDDIHISKLTTGKFEGSYNTQINYALNPKKADRTVIYEPITPFTFEKFEVIDKDGTEMNKSFNEFYGFKKGRSTYAYGTLFGGDRRKITYENLNANNDLNVLLLKDSFMNTITPYLAQNFSKLTVLDSRYYSEFSLKKVLTSEHYDMIIIAFHDDNLFHGNYDFEKIDNKKN